MASSTALTIGKLSKATGTKVVTIRYYEQVGILPVPPRTSGRYRVYGADHLHTLRFIRRCRDLGFTLDQIRDLLRLSSRQDQACAEVDRITAGHLTEIERKVADLTRLADELRRINGCCQGDGIVADCRIIEALSPTC
ncbi:MAG: helix-turn-helix domain-containing protein [Gammaproteobacteria bacterium]